MLLIQFQEHSGRAVSCPFAPYTGEIEGAYTYIRTRRACVQGFINWITPDETSVRDASGYPRGERPFRATPLLPFRPANRSSISPSVSFSSSSSPVFLPSFLHLFLLPRALFFRGDRIQELTDAGITIPFVRPAGSDAADFSLEFLSRFGSGGIKHFVREIKRDLHAGLVNTGTG